MNVQRDKMEYPLLDKSTVSKYLPLMDSQGVSMVSRGFAPSTQTNKGFLQVFYTGNIKKKATKNQTWLERRTNFIKRHYREGRKLYKLDGSPTRLHLALVAWAFSPDPKGLKRYAQKNGLKNRVVKKYVMIE